MLKRRNPRILVLSLAVECRRLPRPLTHPVRRRKLVLSRLPRPRRPRLPLSRRPRLPLSRRRPVT